MKNFIFYDYVYNEEEFQILKDICDAAIWQRKGDKVNSNQEFINDMDGNRYVTIPKTYLSPDKIIKFYLNYIPKYASNCLETGFENAKGYTPDIKLSKYEKGDLYGWHCDYWATATNPVWKRQISSITYINDDYEGGETEFEGNVVIKPEAGKTLIFPSSWTFPHQGRPVIEGTKYIYINHIWV